MRGTSEQIFLRDANCKARAFVGGDGRMRLWDAAQRKTVTIDGQSGDIFFRSADCAEEFDVSDSSIEPGTVMVLSGEGRIEPCQKPYDKSVVGTISGAGGLAPALVLDKNEGTNARLPTALMGKAFCKVDGARSRIEAGDLLTTSSTLGHAMKAESPIAAFGAVLGKALRGLNEGQGLIPILVTLQ